MPTEEFEERQASINRKVMRYFGLFMAAAYVLLGIVITRIPEGAWALSNSQKISLGLIFVLYGCYRLFKTYRQYFRSKA